ncbi:NADPH-dependent 2,4-dienoyl-CoA reductase [Brevibacillus reuszeri]|uniref:2,4-dienoyl-CoA reductase n=1 Tax=Brevibacillus reuszeri TaxID=54915 RepID=A0A0K9YU53_9BACL|nr:NADPH-dependent 2,4-dienoyl-CoA reductase [Brevibacillus reuszeri]KNB72211.1 2,4-dienoyl-CoA reductase [Brevibacillus reuszeri]MED1855846.1 NADPH-dependent 2,4-dienoyl-CoA reductase [Brevibacillus reuszeri]GED72188.1 NADPH-dependent 2,4-dienoyl-CoA reductase [Brevibacillus reuszeri]
MRLTKVFEPIQIGSLTLPNRIMMGSMHVGFEKLEDGVNRLAAFYAERARGEAGLIVTGGAAVLPEGGMGEPYCNVFRDEDMEALRLITTQVHEAKGRIALQLFHAGRYAHKEQTGYDPVAPSPLQAPINRTKPRELGAEEIEFTIQAFAEGAIRAKKSGFDAVEIMGSEGYLINQFLSPVTNKRDDEWGGDFSRRARFGVEVAKRVRQAVGTDYPIIFRMSGIDLIPDSTTMEETLLFARMLEQAGMDALNVGIGWHESRVPTIAMMVPRGAYVWVAQQVKEVVGIPVIASNRINDLRQAEAILQEGRSDLVSMARPFLADSQIVRKSRESRYDEVNTCIACNQACLDHIFDGKVASCLVNPLVGREQEWAVAPAVTRKKVAVVGAGPAGLEAARVLAERGHRVVIMEKSWQIGGQLNYARQVPGKEEFNETLRYYKTQLNKLGVEIRLGCAATADALEAEGFEEVVVATGVIPRLPEITGVDLAHVVRYDQVFDRQVKVGRTVAIVGAGGIACDLSHLLLKEEESITPQVAKYLREYQILTETGIELMKPSKRKIYMLRRGKHVGTGLGKTTRWAVLDSLGRHGVEMITQMTYKKITPDGVLISQQDEERLIPADTVIVAAGATSNDSLFHALQGRLPVHVIGGAREAGELDAKRAIRDGSEVGRII